MWVPISLVVCLQIAGFLYHSYHYVSVSISKLFRTHHQLIHPLSTESKKKDPDHKFYKTFFCMYILFNIVSFDHYLWKSDEGGIDKHKFFYGYLI